MYLLSGIRWITDSIKLTFHVPDTALGTRETIMEQRITDQPSVSHVIEQLKMHQGEENASIYVCVCTHTHFIYVCMFPSICKYW